MEKRFIVSGFGKQYYCKITESNQSYTFSLGGRRYYCITIAIRSDSPDVGYIDRMEYNEACAKDGSLEHKKGIWHLGITALWAFHIRFPQIKYFTLMDDSHIYCEDGSKVHKLNLAYDYILKYNKTWYEDKFNAYLPSPLMEMYKESCKVLDEPIDAFAFMVEREGRIRPYEKIYNDSKTPREFLNKLRTHLGTQYCFEVGKWLSSYIELLRITIFKMSWMINIEDIHKPDNFSIAETKNEMRGGGKKQTRKNQRPRNFSIISGNDEEGTIVGYYSA
jgi:hypothetical protein